jgi:hypothetical protein
MKDVLRVREPDIDSLIDIFGERTHVFIGSERLAMLIGLEGALIVSKIAYWIKHPCTENNIVDDKRWVYNSWPNWQEDNFPYWSETKVRRQFDKLRKEGILLSGCYNKDGRDRTLWWTLNMDKIREIYREAYQTGASGHNGQMHPHDTDRPLPMTTPKDYSQRISYEHKQEQIVSEIFETDFIPSADEPAILTHPTTKEWAEKIWENSQQYFEADRWDVVSMVFAEDRESYRPTANDLRIILDVFAHRYFRQRPHDGLRWAFIEGRYKPNGKAHFLTCDAMAAGFTFNSRIHIDFLRRGDLAALEAEMHKLLQKLHSKGGSFRDMCDVIHDYKENNSYWYTQDYISISAFIEQARNYINDL